MYGQRLSCPKLSRVALEVGRRYPGWESFVSPMTVEGHIKPGVLVNDNPTRKNVKAHIYIYVPLILKPSRAACRACYDYCCG